MGLLGSLPPVAQTPLAWGRGETSPQLPPSRQRLQPSFTGTSVATSTPCEAWRKAAANQSTGCNRRRTILVISVSAAAMIVTIPATIKTQVNNNLQQMYCSTDNDNDNDDDTSNDTDNGNDHVNDGSRLIPTTSFNHVWTAFCPRRNPRIFC